MGVDPLNPPPELVDDVTLRIRFSRCNACERAIVDGDDVHVRVVHDPDTGEAWTVAVHIPECPT